MMFLTLLCAKYVSIREKIRSVKNILECSEVSNNESESWDKENIISLQLMRNWDKIFFYKVLHSFN